jgi:hypothetical protein
MAYGLVEGRDGERVLPIVVEDEEVPDPDLMDAAEPPPTAGKVHRVRAVKEDICGIHTHCATTHP